MVINKVDRSSKFEVLRIISMILIINFHIYILEMIYLKQHFHLIFYYLLLLDCGGY